ncbi:hypothetical protein [uncultured Bacteroides sp.]|uniref:hypothetical protein n=1 Tax=uncultured Bacteroides sp. TaxID=162156 RepID=UPI000822A9AE|nr:hypothetical protein [uncultured Bacteroides sp.]SCG93604.1 Uncharacterised protein [uncultured Bacteroides sp.]
MRKVTRKSLDELAKVMPVISEENQRMHIGGTSGATGYIGATGTTGVTGWTGYYDGDCTGYAGGNYGGGDIGGSGSSTGYYGTTGTTGSTGYNYGGTGNYTGTAYGDSGSGYPPYAGEGSTFNPYIPNNGVPSNGVMDSGSAYTSDNPCPYKIYSIQIASGSWGGGYVEGIGYRPKQTEADRGDGQPKNWVKSLLNALYEGAGKGTINLTDIIPVGNTPSTSYCTTSASFQTITINGATLTNVYIEATSSAAHPQVSTGYSWVKPVYDNNARLVKNSYYFDVAGSDLDVVITVPVDQIKKFESLYKKSH